MADPKGRLVTPVAFRDDGSLHALELDDSDQLKVSVEASALPTGAATSANQTTMITALQLIDDLRAALDSVGTDELRNVALPHGIWDVSGVTQVQARAAADNSIGTIYTVPSGKTFYLTSLYMYGANASAGLGAGYAYIRTGVPAEVVRWDIPCQAAGQFAIHLTFNPPIKMPEDYDILIRSQTADYDVYGTIHGYTV